MQIRNTGQMLPGLLGGSVSATCGKGARAASPERLRNFGKGAGAASPEGLRNTALFTLLSLDLILVPVCCTYIRYGFGIAWMEMEPNGIT